MIRFLLIAASLVLAPLPATAQQAGTGLMLEHRALLRCSAAFALVAHGQESGNPDTLGYPPLAEAGREYFVHAMARIMDDTGMTRDEVADELTREAQGLLEGGKLREIMPPCLIALENFKR